MGLEGVSNHRSLVFEVISLLRSFALLSEINFAKKSGEDTTGLHSSEPQLKGIVNQLLKDKREQAA